MSCERVFFYCQHSVGMGHLVRSVALVEQLARRFDVVLFSGGPWPRAVSVPDGVQLVSLSPLAMAEDRGLVSLDPTRTVDEALQVRRDTLVRFVDTQRPAAIIIELFPFGRKKFAVELVPFLEAARRLRTDRPRPVVCSSVRDLLVRGRADQQRHDDRAASMLREFFDAVLFHGDGRIAGLDETFRPSRPSGVPVFETGFVVRGRVPTGRSGSRTVLVSAGGGRVGGSLFRAVLSAWPCTSPAFRARWRLRIVGGPFLPDHEWRAIERKAASVDRVELVRSVPDLRSLLAAAGASVSQAGYNTTLEVLRARIPALLVPYVVARGGDEQVTRARRLARLGAVRMEHPLHLTPERLGSALEQLVGFQPNHEPIDCDGSARTVSILERLLAARVGPAPAVV